MYSKLEHFPNLLASQADHVLLEFGKVRLILFWTNLSYTSLAIS